MTHDAPPARDGWSIRLAERGWIPDALIRMGIRRLCRQRDADLQAGGDERAAERQRAFRAAMAEAPIALVPDKANAQHYEVPASFYATCLGPRRKYSSCYYPGGVDDLATAEEAALAETLVHADLDDGQSILELGCGWGSLTLWMAERLPHARIVAVSNSASQRAFIMDRLKKGGHTNVTVIQADMNDFTGPPEPVDRIVSVEMFEHMRNWPALFRRMHEWMRPDGRAFLHVFCHRDATYAFQEDASDDWMGRHFFSGGIMPAADLARHFDDALTVEAEWSWDGTHYARTSEHWLENLDAHREAALVALGGREDPAAARVRFQRWRIFFMACAELFGLDGGATWGVVHWRLRRTEDVPAADDGVGSRVGVTEDGVATSPVSSERTPASSAG